MMVHQTHYQKKYNGNRTTRYGFQHIAIWKKENGLVPDGYEIHHINGVKHDNRLKNLVANPSKARKDVISKL